MIRLGPGKNKLRRRKRKASIDYVRYYEWD
jgi:hypothetical protein